MLIEYFGGIAQTLLASHALLPVFSHPGLVALARGGIFPRKRQRCDLLIGNTELLVRAGRKNSYARVSQSRACTAIEDVSLNFIAVLQRYTDVSAIIERLF